MARKEELEILLRTVNDIKGEHYVGTKDAYDAIKELQACRVNPVLTAGYINKALKKRFENPTYIATPERLGGIQHVLREAKSYASEPFRFEDPEVGTEAVLECNSKGYKVFSLDLEVHAKPKDSAKLLYPYFSLANNNRVSNDDTFGRNFPYYAMREYVRTRKDIQEEMQESCDKWMSMALVSLERADFATELSRPAFNSRETENARGIMMSKLSTRDIIERIVNDRIDDRLEYRRQVLCKWLNDCRFQNYEQALDLASEQLEMRKTRFEKLVEMNAPTNIIKSSEVSVRTSTFLKQLLESEKNFVNRFLRN